MQLFTFTGSLLDTAATGVRSAVKALYKAVQSIAADIRAYRSLAQIEVSPAARGHRLANCHAHGTLLLPQRSRPEAEDIAARWHELLPASGRSIDLSPVRDLTAWAVYSTKPESLSLLLDDPVFFAEYSGQVKGQKMHFWVN